LIPIRLFLRDRRHHAHPVTPEQAWGDRVI
jgi:hypothetical protein